MADLRRRRPCTASAPRCARRSTPPSGTAAPRHPGPIVELPGPRRPQARVWTDHRVRRGATVANGIRWRCGRRSSWHSFLDFVADDRLYAMWWLIALRGLRRGEAAGLRWVDVDLDAGSSASTSSASPTAALSPLGPPKTAASRRTIALDSATVAILRAAPPPSAITSRPTGIDWNRLRLRVHHNGRGGATPGLPDPPLPPPGHPVRPAAGAAARPPRHARPASPTPLAPTLKTVQAMLGHTSIVLTADTYTSALHELHFTAAEATARLVLANRRPQPRPQAGTPSRQTPEKSAAPPPGINPESFSTKRIPPRPKAAAAAHMRHHRVPKDQSRIARWLYGLLKVVRRQGLEPRTRCSVLPSNALAPHLAPRSTSRSGACRRSRTASLPFSYPTEISGARRPAGTLSSSGLATGHRVRPAAHPGSAGRTPHVRQGPTSRAAPGRAAADSAAPPRTPSAGTPARPAAHPSAGPTRRGATPRNRSNRTAYTPIVCRQ